MTQKQFDFNRAVQLRALEQCSIPTGLTKTGGLMRNHGTLKAVLKGIDSYQRDQPNCFPSIPTLARNTGLSERSVQRAIRRLKALGILKIDPRLHRDGSHASNLYQIDWGRVLELVPRELCPNPGGEGGDNVTGGGDNMTPPWCQDVTTSKRPHRNDQLKRPSFHVGDVLSSREKDVSTERRQAPKQFWGRSGDLTRADLRDPRTLQHLFEFALARNWGGLKRSEADRLKFFALCIYVAERGEHTGKCLTDAVKNQRYGNIGLPHEDEAKEIIRRARGPVAPMLQGVAFKSADTGDGPRRDARAELARLAALERASR